jgi:hypothetical protein
VRIDDRQLAEIDERGFVVVEGFLGAAELAAAQACLADNFPEPSDYFADPGRYPQFGASQFAGLRRYPFRGWDLNRLAFHPDLVDAVERYFGTDDIELYKGELWAKYSGAIDYDQNHHRDFSNHSIVAPRTDGLDRQLTTFLLLSDVTADDGPTALVPLFEGASTPFFSGRGRYSADTAVAPGAFADVEVPATGPAGSLLLYRSDVLHRATTFRGHGRSRFTMLVDFQRRGPTWAGKMSWPDRSNNDQWGETMERATPVERRLFGFPAIGDPYWNEQTLADVQARYPRMDMRPYRIG